MARIALMQLNPTVGDLENNAWLMREAYKNAMEARAAVVVFPSGALSGLPLGSLAADKDFIKAGKAYLKTLAADFHNRAFFDEIFTTISEPLIEPQLIVKPTAQPYFRGSPKKSWSEGSLYAKENNVWLAVCNLVGGQDDTIYAGGSFVADPQGIIRAASLFREDMLLFDLDLPLDQNAVAKGDTIYLDSISEIGDLPYYHIVRETRDNPESIVELYRALTLSIRDYIDKNRIKGVAVSLSGGIDSAVVATLAADALGPERIKALTLPGPFTSRETLADAKQLAANLGIPIEEISIVPAYETARAALANVFAAGNRTAEDLPGQNIQARLRGIYIMALANSQGLLALNCSNKSEGMVGYGTMYGDIIGGFSPLCDVWKTDVWKLANHANELAQKERIPQTIIDRVPSAELRQNQEDRHSIPDYPILDAILRAFVDQGLPYSAILEQGFDKKDVQKAINLYYANEFKRQQAPRGPLVTKPCNERRVPPPVVNLFRPW